MMITDEDDNDLELEREFYYLLSNYKLLEEEFYNNLFKYKQG